MNTKEKVSEFIKEVFSIYNIDTFGYFEDMEYDDDDDEVGHVVEVPLFEGDDIDEETLDYISHTIGLTKDEILKTDKEAAMKYWNKYPYFSLYHKYVSELDWSYTHKDKKPNQEEMLLWAIFGEKTNIKVEDRYNYRSVKSRMIKKLKEINEVIPGTYHDFAEITNLSISTETFMSFPEIHKMLNSFFDIVDFLEKKFFEALNVGLSYEDELEYDFLVHSLRVIDTVMPSVLLTYETIQTYGKAYKEENYDSFREYARIKSFINTCPWRCKEFFEDMDSVQKFVYIFPQSKVEMRKFALEVAKFECFFVWSDAKPIMDSPEEEELFKDTDFYIPLDERAKEPTRVYVDKTSKELFDWKPYIANLNKAASPVNKGGLKVIMPQNPYLRERLERRIAVHNGGDE